MKKHDDFNPQPPWEVVRDDDGSYAVQFISSDRQVWLGYGLTKEKAELIAAAPGLLAALQMVASDVRSGSFPTPIQNAINEAIAKATNPTNLKAPYLHAPTVEICAGLLQKLRLNCGSVNGRESLDTALIAIRALITEPQPAPEEGEIEALLQAAEAASALDARDALLVEAEKALESAELALDRLGGKRFIINGQPVGKKIDATLTKFKAAQRPDAST